MRVLLKNAETRLYFINPNQWTDDPTKATDFEQVDLAAQVYHSRDLAYAQIVLEPSSLSRPAALSEDTLKYARAQG